MTRVGHLTDLHLDGSRARAERVSRGLRHAARLGCRHVAITGDLTAAGRRREFDQLAGVLAPWVDSLALTVVPGNHDLAGGVRSHLEGSELGRLLGREGSVHYHLDGCFVVGLDSRMRQRSPLYRARGRLPREQLELLDDLAAQTPHPVLACVHHGPQGHPLESLDGLVNRAELLDLLARRPNVHVLCGHDHRSRDACGGRVHVAPAVVDCKDPLRVYDVDARGVRCVRRGDPGRYLSWH